MKAKIKQIVSAYNALGNAKLTKLDDAEKGKVLKARKAMRPIADDFSAFLKDCEEKFKPENWDELQGKLQQWQQEGDKDTTLTIEERKSINKALVDYQRSINKVTNEELEKEVELELEKLSEGADIKIMSASDWTPNQLDEIEILL